jgi:tRNA A37 threonylcarbamoyladenosine synthetase subunit TsaC/SUA5/YrdC
VVRALQSSLKALDADALAAAVRDADVLEDWIKDVRALAHQMLEQGLPVPGFKLVPKRATRQWVDEDFAKQTLAMRLPPEELMVSKLISPAQAEKLLKKQKLELPGELVVAISSGNTMAPESDPRPAVLQIGQQLSGRSW